MYPYIKDNDSILIAICDRFFIGDVIVYKYKRNTLLVHRIISKKSDIYYCKGDNSFRLEDIKFEQIVGKVVQINNKPVSPCNPELVSLSYMVNRQFFKNKYDIEKTKKSGIYLFYQEYINNRIGTELLYRRAVLEKSFKFEHSRFDNVFAEQILSILSVESSNLLEIAEKYSDMSGLTLPDSINSVREFLPIGVSNCLVEVVVPNEYLKE